MSWQNIELLAPAGTPAVLENVVEAGADAVYLGGKRFNMRLLRPEFNFSDEELAEAVNYLHQRNKKLYITVNNLYKQSEVDEIKDYLLFLDKIQVDALIVQDLGLIQLCQEMNIHVPLHASVQMGINNLEAVRELEDNGFSRVILSKNISLAEIQAIHDATRLGIEFFAHGDLCVAHTGQCFLSSFIFGESGNRGRCRKPCRWSYRLSGLDRLENHNAQYYLAHKDLCLYPYLADLIQAGVSSFKIEGRMRSGEQLAHIVSAYRQALDAYIADPLNYSSSEKDYQELYEKRVRDYTSGSLFRPSNYEDIGLSGVREPAFKTAAIPLTRLSQADYQNQYLPLPVKMPELTVAVGDPESMQTMLDRGVDNIIIGMESMRQHSMYWNVDTIRQALARTADFSSRVLIETPRIVSQQDLADIYKLMKLADSKHIDGFVVNDLGSLRILRATGLSLWTGYGLNISNVRANAFLKMLGVERVMASLEMKDDDLQVLLQADTPMELLVQGPLPALISDLCIVSSASAEGREGCSQDCVNSKLALLDEYGQAYKIYSDAKCRNYLYYPYERCLYPYLALLISRGLQSLRIDGQNYGPELLTKVVTIYQQAMQTLQEAQGNNQAGFMELLELFTDGLTAMPLFGCNKGTVLLLHSQEKKV